MNRIKTLVFLLPVLAADAPAPSPSADRIGGSILPRCVLLQLFTPVVRHEGYVPLWVLRAFMSPVRACL